MHSEKRILTRTAKKRSKLFITRKEGRKSQLSLCCLSLLFVVAVAINVVGVTANVVVAVAENFYYFVACRELHSFYFHFFESKHVVSLSL